MRLVIDSSITLAWYFEDEVTDAADLVLQRVMKEGAVAPTLWRFEVANGLQMALRRKRIDTEFRTRVLSRLDALSIDVDAEGDRYAWSVGLRLSDRHSLTLYDAMYVELAQRRRAELATLDVAMARAAQVEGIPVLGR